VFGRLWFLPEFILSITLWGSSASFSRLLNEFRDERVGELSRGRNGVETLPNFGKAMVFDELTTFQFPCHDHGGHEGKTGAVPREEAQHRHVVDLGGDTRSDSVLLEKEVEGDAQVAVERGQSEGRIFEVVGKDELFSPSTFWPDQCDFLLLEKMAVPFGFGIPAHREIGEDEVERVSLKLTKQVTKAA
jgi:hypothetical protein